MSRPNRRTPGRGAHGCACAAATLTGSGGRASGMTVREERACRPRVVRLGIEFLQHSLARSPLPTAAGLLLTRCSAHRSGGAYARSNSGLVAARFDWLGLAVWPKGRYWPLALLAREAPRATDASVAHGIGQVNPVRSAAAADRLASPTHGGIRSAMRQRRTHGMGRRCYLWPWDWGFLHRAV
jgi:hypothetical protein